MNLSEKYLEKLLMAKENKPVTKTGFSLKLSSLLNETNNHPIIILT